MTAARWAAASIVDVREAAARWLTSDALATVAASLGGPVIVRVPQDLPAFLNWTTDTLDTRRGAERHQAAAGFGPAAAAALIGAAGPLGLLETAPPALPGYDVTVVLGGTVTGNRLRVALAASLPPAGVAPGLVVALAAHRPLTVAEISAAAPHPVGETTEWQHLFRTACDAFGAAAAPPTGHRRASDYQTAIDWPAEGANGEVSLRLMAAPTTDPSRRANTADALDFLAQRIPVEHRRRSLVITSAIYVPYQFLTAAPRLLGREPAHVEVIGTPTATDDRHGLLAQRIGQEIHAAVLAATRLWP
ncbi:MAG TPA: hypothetical protein VN840_03600 [Streptosporangiaceae bacterium]|nr:hypothetical protein [Streptosporangiaceae bacterium]